MKKILRGIDENKWTLIMIFIIVIIPLLFFYLYFLPDYYSNIEKTEIENGYKFVKGTEAPNILTPIKSIYRYSFEILDYEFCFKNVGTTIKIFYTNGTEKKVFIDNNLTTNLKLTVLGEDIVKTLQKDVRYCESINLDKISHIGWEFSSTFTANETSYIIRTEQIPDWDVSLEPEKWSKRTFLFLFILSYWAVLWLFTRIVHLVHWGIKKDKENKKLHKQTRKKVYSIKKTKEKKK